MGQYTMEISLFLIIIFFGIWVIRLKRDLRINIPKEVSSLSSLEIRAIKNQENQGPNFINVQSKGVLPVYSPTDLAFVISVVTKDRNGRIYPVLSVIDTFQKPNSTVFQDVNKIGIVHENTGFENWTTIGSIPTGILQPAFGEVQQLKIHIRLIDIDNPPKDFDDESIGFISCDYAHAFSMNGYHEEGEHVNEARVLSIKLGVAVAFSDSTFHEMEKIAFDNWIIKMINPYNREKRIQLKNIYNNALKEACEAAENEGLDIKEICKELCKIGEEAQNYETLELAHEVMIADNKMHPQEEKVIKDIAFLLGIDDDELNDIRKHKVHKLNKIFEQN